jgi:hypothetical protein
MDLVQATAVLEQNISQKHVIRHLIVRRQTTLGDFLVNEGTAREDKENSMNY